MLLIPEIVRQRQQTSVNFRPGQASQGYTVNPCLKKKKERGRGRERGGQGEGEDKYHINKPHNTNGTITITN